MVYNSKKNKIYGYILIVFIFLYTYIYELVSTIIIVHKEVPEIDLNFAFLIKNYPMGYRSHVEFKILTITNKKSNEIMNSCIRYGMEIKTLSYSDETWIFYHILDKNKAFCYLRKNSINGEPLTIIVQKNKLYYIKVISL